uniref:Fibropellin-1 n=1 Tax=Magallana gigas TaxID=29159 RepID=K1QP38_MAGGI
MECEVRLSASVGKQPTILVRHRLTYVYSYCSNPQNNTLECISGCTVADFDGDNIRCRFALGLDECGSICSNHSSYLTLNETACAFYFHYDVSYGDYAVALQIEDFTDSSSSVPLSSVPLQVTEFHVMSPLPFTMSAISQPIVDEYQVTMSLESVVNNVIGTYVVCFSAETNKSPSSFEIQDWVSYFGATRTTILTIEMHYKLCPNTYHWIGLNDIANEGTFVWVKDSTIVFEIVDIDDCNPEPCQNNGTCTDLVNGFQCDCVAGFNGANCENNIDECASEPCQNNGTCIDLINDYTCACTVGFNGTNCTIDIDECASEPCQNNGTCIDLINDYTCACTVGFNGTNCTIDIDDCNPEPCQNNGTCTDLVNDYHCDCVAGFNGTNCDINIDECASEPCQNNGTCIDLINDYTCACTVGFNGTNCTIDIDECASEPCQNNGTCIDLINDYTCACTVGFNGTNCTIDIDDCNPEPCQNNGTCTDLVNDYHCDCVAGFNGTNCDINVDLCASSPCKNNGTCTNLINSFQCQCPLEFNGTTCSMGSTVVINSIRKGSLIVDFDLIIPDDPVSKVQVVDTVYKLVNGLAFVNYSGEVVNVTSASFNSSAGTVIITNSTDGCSIMNSMNVCLPEYRCHEFNNYTVACISGTRAGKMMLLYSDSVAWSAINRRLGRVKGTMSWFTLSLTRGGSILCWFTR